MAYQFQFKYLVMLAAAFAVSAGVAALPPAARATDLEPPSPQAKPHLDLSGRKRIGNASFYAKKFAGRKMADGTPMQAQGDNAASKTLPLGTTAMVTNLETGRTAIVTIRDRGPYVKGRIVDLSPATARKIDVEPQEGVAKVEVAPLEVPLPDGSVKPGVPDTDAEKAISTYRAISR